MPDWAECYPNETQGDTLQSITIPDQLIRFGYSGLARV
jgi:hypothetical protein